MLSWSPKQSKHSIYLLTACLAGLLIMLRNPIPLFRPELWAEDGEIFFYDFFYFGPISVFYPVWSSFHFLARLVALIAAYAPSLYIPAIYAWISFFIYILAFLYFLRDSFSYLIPSLTMRIIFVLLMTTALGSWEVQMNLSNLMYLLGAFMALLSLEKPVRSSFLYLCLWSILSFSSPVFYVFLPFHFLMWIFTKNNAYLKVFNVLLITCYISIINVIFHCWDHPSPAYPFHAVTTLSFSSIPNIPEIIISQFFYGIHFIIIIGQKWFTQIMIDDWKLLQWSWFIMISALLFYCIRKKIFMELLLLCMCISLIFSIQCIARPTGHLFFSGKFIAHIGWNFRYAFIGGMLGVILALSIAYRCYISGKKTMAIMLSLLVFYNVIFYTNHDLTIRQDIHWPAYAKQLDNIRDELRHGKKNADDQLPDLTSQRPGAPKGVRLHMQYPF